MSYPTSSWEKYLSPQEAQVYSRLFKLASQTKPGIVTGTEAVQFFANSGVPNGILSDVIKQRKKKERKKNNKQDII